MFELQLCSQFDGPVFSPPKSSSVGTVFAGPQKLLQWLESQYGETSVSANTEYLRIELFRQSLVQHAHSDPGVFYRGSLEADRYATAEVLLAWRDELLLLGWDFVTDPKTPDRLKALAEVAHIFHAKIEAPEHEWLAKGFADRFMAALRKFEANPLGLASVQLYEPSALMPLVLRRFVDLAESLGVSIREVLPGTPAEAQTDLGRLQRLLDGQQLERKPANADGSLLILRSRRDSDAATWLASLLAENPAFRPLVLAPEMNRTLEQSMNKNGLPSTGILSASLARPSLQVLKLAPAFLWEPVDVYKIMEFVTLPLKPLDEGLSQTIARVLAEKPGLFSDTWFAATLGYLESDQAGPQAARGYEFWFNRRRYAADAFVPKDAVMELYAFIREWALDEYRSGSNKISSLPVLAEQARRIVALLQALPDEQLGFLELERIVRTIYEPSPVQLAPAEARHLPYVHHKGAIAGVTESVLWWNCVFDTPVLQADHWQPEERSWLSSRNLEPDTVQRAGRLQWFHSKAPVCAATQQLVLVVPDFAEGSVQQPNLLMSDLEAAFSNLEAISCTPQDAFRLASFFKIPAMEPALLQPATGSLAQLPIHRPELAPASEYDTPTQLESLFYYPYLWFFKQKLKLNPVSLYSIAPDFTLLGSLAHRFFELMLKEDTSAWKKEDCHAWIMKQSRQLLEKEGATLLLYGREPERSIFLRKLQRSAWSLLSLLRQNNWKVAGTEVPLEGTFAGRPIRARADLLLERGDERAIIDLKWSGLRKRKEMIRNLEDLQLTLYASLLAGSEKWPHTGYFILEEGKMVARNKSAFTEADVPGEAQDHAAAAQIILGRMEKTLHWRLAQIAAGKLEIRNARTAGILDDLYADEVMDLLEMRQEDARYDDFRGLLT